MRMIERIRGLVHQFTALTPRGRVLRGTAANVFAGAVIAFNQLLQIPILTHAWGVEIYGIWLMLIAIPFYIALVDAGIVAAATVELTRRVNSGDRPRARETFQSLALFLGLVLLAIALVGAGAAVWLTLQPRQDFSGLSSDRLAIGAAAVLAYGLLLIASQVWRSVLRATHKMATDSMHNAVSYLFEGLVLVGAALAGGDLALSALAFAATRLLSTVVLVAMTLRLEPWARLGLDSISTAHIRELFRPSAAAFALAVSGAVSIQGSILVLGIVAGPFMVAVFGATRTLTRLPLQVIGFALRPTIPELTRAYADGNQPLVRRLLLLNLAIALSVSLPFMLGLSLFGPVLLDLISGGRLAEIPWLFALLSLAMVLNTTWMALAAPFVATNRHGLFSYWYLWASLASVLSVFIVPGDPVYVLVSALCGAEGLLLCVLAFHSFSIRRST